MATAHLAVPSSLLVEETVGYCWHPVVFWNRKLRVSNHNLLTAWNCTLELGHRFVLVHRKRRLRAELRSIFNNRQVKSWLFDEPIGETSKRRQLAQARACDVCGACFERTVFTVLVRDDLKAREQILGFFQADDERVETLACLIGEGWDVVFVGDHHDVTVKVHLVFDADIQARWSEPEVVQVAKHRPHSVWVVVMEH
jgi:hypothetical protein